MVRELLFIFHHIAWVYIGTLVESNDKLISMNQLTGNGLVLHKVLMHWISFGRNKYLHYHNISFM